VTPWVLRLILSNALVFIATSVSPRVEHTFSFVPALFLERPWTILTYMFLHAGIGHILFNMLALYFFGPRLELELGGGRFMALYLVSGVFGGLLSFVMSPMVGIVGASGAIFGVMFGFAYLWPREHVYIWAILPVEARWMVVGMTILSLMGGFGLGDMGVAHFAHLGGFLGGFIVMKMAGVRPYHAILKAMPAPALPKIDVTRWSGIRREELHPVNREEYDRIWAKLASAGVESLSPSEVAFLDRFSSL
jgi:membrane associated rhomboid family serine protease